jgi:hypothetical protein
MKHLIALLLLLPLGLQAQTITNLHQIPFPKSVVVRVAEGDMSTNTAEMALRALHPGLTNRPPSAPLSGDITNRVPSASGLFKPLAKVDPPLDPIFQKQYRFMQDTKRPENRAKWQKLMELVRAANRDPNVKAKIEEARAAVHKYVIQADPSLLLLLDQMNEPRKLYRQNGSGTELLF